MQNPKQLTEIAKGVNCRFFKTIDELVSIGKIKSLSGFCVEFGLSAPRYREMRSTYGKSNANMVSRYKSIEIEALYHLCNYYAVSTEWLLFGCGKIFRNEANGKI